MVRYLVLGACCIRAEYESMSVFTLTICVILQSMRGKEMGRKVFST